MVVSVDLIRALRTQTGAGIMECKQALEQTQGDMDKAAESLRDKGFAKAAKRSDRETNQGVVQAYIHTGGRVGAIIELGCETDFVARTPEFQSLAHDIAMQVAAMAPAYLDESDKEEDDDRPAAQVCLLKQPFIKGNSNSVADIVQEMAAKVGENVRVVRFNRLALGE
ncbi:MAG: elongation factor Ts [Dehalococcoidia bacterium]|mgnify:FL=1|nr:elongation factor Ts [Dehalococcoidia bacterium]